MPFLPEVIGVATGNPYLYASLKGAQTAGEGGDLGDVVKSAGTAYVTATVGQNLLGTPTGVETGPFDIAGNPDVLGGSSAVALGDVSQAPVSTATQVPAQEVAYPGVEVQQLILLRLVRFKRRCLNLV